jgi:hypothetical protein
VFVTSKPMEPHELPSCAICLSPVPERESFRFRRKAEESYHSGFRFVPVMDIAARLRLC